MITREADYAIRALVMAAIHQKDNTPSTTTLLSKEMMIPYRFLRKIMMKLKNEGYIDTKKGKSGGIRLKKKSSEISIIDVINLFSSSTIYLNRCTRDNKPCKGMEDKCKLHIALAGIQVELNKMLQDVTIDKLV